MCEVNFRNVLICQADLIRPVVSLTMMGFRGGVEERMIGVHFYFDELSKFLVKTFNYPSLNVLTWSI